MVDFSHPFSFSNSSRPENSITVDSTSGQETFFNFPLKHANSSLCIMLKLVLIQNFPGPTLITSF